MSIIKNPPASQAQALFSLDELCDRFEDACVGGTQPRVEEFVSDVPEPQRLESLRELLRVDVHYRWKANEAPSFAEYRSRFPQLDSAWLNELLTPASSRSAAAIAAAVAAGPRQPEIHEQFGVPNVPGYELLEEIGRGGMGIVFRARQLSLNRLVALKMVLAGELAGPELLERFRSEARAVARLQHPNLVQIYEVGEYRGRPFLSFEFIEGGSLDQMLRGIPQPPRSAAQLLKTLSHAVQFAHSRGVVHRDLKPANILLSSHSATGPAPDSTLTITDEVVPNPDPVNSSGASPSSASRSEMSDPETPRPVSEPVGKPLRDLTADSSRTLADVEYGFPKISDFGLAKHLEDDAAKTRTGAILGTPSYMAPEQARGLTSQIGPATDVYALGAILYEMLTGRPPFRAPTVIETLDQVRETEPLSLRGIQPGVPRDLETICLKCLQKEPARRYESAGALADDLDRFLRDEPVLARPVNTTERLFKWSRRHPTVATLVVLLATVTCVGVAAVVGLWRQAESRRELAVDERGKSDRARRAADESRKTADLERRAAQTARDAADKARQAVERSLHFQRIATAYGAWQSFQGGRANRLLDECPEAMRDWEWSYLKSLCHSEIRTLRGHTDQVSCIAFSDDGKWIASGSGRWGFARPGEVILWDAATGERRAVLQDHDGAVMSVAFSPDSQRLASTSIRWETRGPRSVTVWSITGEKLYSLPANSTEVHAVRFSPDGRWLATDGPLGVIELWDATSGQPVRTLTAEGIRTATYSLAFSPDSQRVASVGRDGVWRLWSCNGETKSFAQGGYGDLRRVAFGPDGRHVSFTNYGDMVHTWSVTPAPKELSRQRVFGGIIASLTYSPEGRRIAVASDDGSVRIFDAAAALDSDGRLIDADALQRVSRQVQHYRGHEGPVFSLAFSPDGRWLATGGSDRTIKIWDTRADTVEDGIHLSPVFGCDVQFLPDSRRVLVPSGFNRSSPGRNQRSLALVDIVESRVVKSFNGHTQVLTDVEVNRDGTRIATASEDNTARIWETESGQQRLLLGGHAAAVTSVSFNADGRLVATACADGTLRIWNAETGEKQREWRGHDGAARSVAFCPSDDAAHLLASAGDDGTIRIWNSETGNEMRVLRGHTGRVNVLAFSQDGHWLASGSDDQTVRLWNPRTGESPHTLSGHGHAITSVTFSASGARLAGCGSHHTIKVWDVVSGQEALTLNEHGSTVTNVAFSPDGKYLASVTGAWLKLWGAGEPPDSPRIQNSFEAANRAWHEREAKSCEISQQYFAAAFHLDRLIQLQPENFPLFRRRASARAELGDWAAALADFAVAMERRPIPADLTFAAYARLGERNLDEYRTLCQRRLSGITGTTSAAEVNSIVWLQLVVPETATDSARLVELAERAVASAANPVDRTMHTNTWAAALYRAGQFEAARAGFLKSIELHGAGGFVEDWLFLAMTEQKLGNTPQARVWLDKAEAFLKAPPEPTAGKPAAAPRWWTRVERDTLMREARSLLPQP